ncbi:hypothetical protein [Parvularcula sp. LCG005]|uniref:hypothetical protein n=1 Tax=Parvularcula sp. LCG005 TaxID=3078805 RepID=UPI002943B748|nr:hypothetical protein [Parvularcula sp. LCG005]WOI52912.1 hypothetical protein RUI03_12215 [Parvularcula sp. LCG005]
MSSNGTTMNASDIDPAAPGTEYDTLKTDVASLREDLRAIAEDIGKLAKSTSAHGVDKGKEYASMATDEVTKARTAAEEKVREYPLSSVGIAFAVGALFATLRQK